MGVKKIRQNRRKSSAGTRSTIFALIMVITVLCGALFFLEWLKSIGEHSPQTAVSERYKLPSRQPYSHIELQPYTSSVSGHIIHRKKKTISTGTVAIIVDDMGSSIQEANSLMSINVPLTFSVIPGLSKAREVDRVAHERGYQVMVHIPMEPKDYPRQRLEDNGLLLSQPDAEIPQRVTSYFNQVPHAAGANNHMGSRFTEDGNKMKVVLNQIKAHGLFYIDSRTTPNSVGLSLAQAMDIDAAGRNVFLDNTKDIGAITTQLEQLASLARKKGSAIGICHPHKVTIQALAINLPRLKGEGISFVHVGDIVR